MRNGRKRINMQGESTIQEELLLKCLLIAKSGPPRFGLFGRLRGVNTSFLGVAKKNLHSGSTNMTYIHFFRPHATVGWGPDRIGRTKEQVADGHWYTASIARQSGSVQ